MLAVANYVGIKLKTQKADLTKSHLLFFRSSGDDISTRLLITASNDGLVKVWSLSNSDGGGFEAEELASVDTKCRITCMALHQVTNLLQLLASKLSLVVEESILRKAYNKFVVKKIYKFL